MGHYIQSQEPRLQNDELRVNIAIGTLTLVITVILLYVLNRLIYLHYHPDVSAAVQRITSWSLMPPDSFKPEPVERMHFQLSVFCSPLFIFLAYQIAKRFRRVFEQNASVSFAVNMAGINMFIAYVYIVFLQELVNLKTTTPYYFNHNLISKFSLVFGLFFYSVAGYFFYRYANIADTRQKKIISNVVSIEIVALVLFHVILYNIFHVSEQDITRISETNAVFYSVSQVLAGKSLLVNINCQYGLFGWFLSPLFKYIGLTIYKFSAVMAILNALSFLCIYLGLRKILKQDLLPLIVFLAVVFWQYWQVKLPFEATPRFYYQYWPIRLLFPSVCFFLVAAYYASTQKNRFWLLPVLAIFSSMAILWNFDSGMVTFVAVFLSLIYTAFNADTWKSTIKRMLMSLAWMAGALFLVFTYFIVSTKMKSGSYPDFGHFADFQRIFYISGYFMMPMSAIHFWNLPVLVYLAAGVFCMYGALRQNAAHPVMAFLFVLGFGLFAYFQGRSWDSTIMIVMYPAIIILGIFCDMLIAEIVMRKLRFHISVIFYFLIFVFLADGAFSMLSYVPPIQTYAWKSAVPDTLMNDAYLQKRNKFITDNFKKNDTVIILSYNFESYYYALGNYYNPVNIPSSTEVFFKSELYALLDTIKKKKYTVVYDAVLPWPNVDTILKTLTVYTYPYKQIEPDHNLTILKPIK